MGESHTLPRCNHFVSAEAQVLCVLAFKMTFACLDAGVGVFIGVEGCVRTKSSSMFMLDHRQA